MNPRRLPALHHLSHPPVRRFVRYLIVVFSVGVVVGCSSLPSGKHANSIPENQEITVRTQTPMLTADNEMISDLMSAIIQIYPPTETTVQVSIAPSSKEYKQVVQALALKGYGVKRVSSDQGSMLVVVDKTSEVAENNFTGSTIRIGIGPVSVGRSYEHDSANETRPVSPFRLYGTRATIGVASTHFGAKSMPNKLVSDAEYAAPDLLKERLPALSLITPELVRRVAENTAGSLEFTSLNSSQVEVNNLFFADSTFESILDNYEPIEELVVIFPNDSIIMGSENRQLIRLFTETFVEESDVISVIGCSNGPTASELGNAGLALGRGERVTNEIIQTGVPRDKVLDEGCWASQGGVKGLPGRGVKLQLLRKKQ